MTENSCMERGSKLYEVEEKDASTMKGLHGMERQRP